MSEHYQWDSPHEWLQSKIKKGEISTNEVVTALLSKIDPDTIQDVFQEEMDKDGYFSHVCPECGEPMAKVMVDLDGTNLEEDWECQNCES